MECLCPSVHPLVSPRRKVWITYIQAYMPHESSEDSSNQPDGPMGSHRCPPWPPGAPRPPHRPPMTPKQVSWPHWTLKITSPAFQIIRRPIKCHCWSYGTSYPSPSGLYSLVLPSSESSPGYISRTYLVQFGLVIIYQRVILIFWLVTQMTQGTELNPITIKD